MKRILLILAIFTAICAASESAAASPVSERRDARSVRPSEQDNDADADSVAQPKIVFLPNATVDLGEMKSGAVAKGTLRFRNDGDAPLQIIRIFTGCGCTDADYPHDPIPPGEEGEIRVSFRSKGYSKGSFLKTMKVKSNAPSRIDRVFIKGRVTD